MSFSVHARRVRDRGLPHAHRRSALRSAVVLYGPFGFRGTWYCLGIAGDLDGDGTALERALDMLELARNTAIAERAAFAARRRAEKREHRRRPSAADARLFAAPRWPGPDGHRMTAREVGRLMAELDGPFPAVPEGTKGDLAWLHLRLSGCISRYRAEPGRPGPDRMTELEQLLPELRDQLFLLHDARGQHPEAYEEFKRLERVVELVLND